MIPSDTKTSNLCGRCGDKHDAMDHARGAIKSLIVALALAEILDNRTVDRLIELFRLEDA